MIGNVKPKFNRCDNEAKNAYMRSYCSLCASLKKNYGFLYSVMLNNELSLVLNALEPDMQVNFIQTTCPSRLYLKKKTAYFNEAVDVAAYLSLILIQIKLIDYLEDNKGKIWLKSQLVQKARKKIIFKAQKQTIKLSLKTMKVVDQYKKVAVDPNVSFNTSVELTYDLSKRMAIEISERTNATKNKIEVLGKLFGHMGELISYLDHILDLDKDIAKKTSNPILNEAVQNNTELVEETVKFFKKYCESEKKIISILEEQSHLFPEVFARTLKNSFRQNYIKMKMLSGEYLEKDEHFEHLYAAACDCDCDDFCCGDEGICCGDDCCDLEDMCESTTCED